MRVSRKLEYLENLVASIKKKMEEENIYQVTLGTEDMTVATVAMVNNRSEEDQPRIEADATSKQIRYVKGMDGQLKSLLLTVSIVGGYVNGKIDLGASQKILLWSWD